MFVELTLHGARAHQVPDRLQGRAQHARAEIGGRRHFERHDFGAGPQRERHAVGALEIDDDALLVSVHAQKHRRHAAFGGRACLSRGVTLGRLDLDDLGAKICQPLAGVGPHEHGAGVDDANACQR